MLHTIELRFVWYKCVSPNEDKDTRRITFQQDFRLRTHFGEIWLAAKFDERASRGVENPDSLFIIKIPVMQHHREASAPGGGKERK